MTFKSRSLLAIAALLVARTGAAQEPPSAPASDGVAAVESTLVEGCFPPQEMFVPISQYGPMAFDGCCCLPLANCGRGGGCVCSSSAGCLSNCCGVDGCCGQSVDACCGQSVDACCGESAQASCGSDVCAIGGDCPPLWTVKAGAVLLHRSAPADIVLAAPIASATVISGDDFEFGWAGGPDVSIARRMSSANSLEVRYFGVPQWDASDTYSSVGDINLGGTNVLGIDSITANYESSLHSTEINWRHQRSERFTWLAGFRWIELHDDLNFNIDFVAPATFDFNWNSDNHLYGAQLGGDLNMWRFGGPLSIHSVFKGGVYGNDADNDFSFLVGPNQIVDAGRSGGDVAFVGELGFASAYQLTQHMALRGGYQLLWIDGVALASDQAGASLAQLNLNILDTTGNVFYHGVLMGLDVTW